MLIKFALIVHGRPHLPHCKESPIQRRDRRIRFFESRKFDKYSYGFFWWGAWVGEDVDEAVLDGAESLAFFLDLGLQVAVDVSTIDHVLKKRER